jgi:methyl-accepting chemotaxis protein
MSMLSQLSIGKKLSINSLLAVVFFVSICAISINLFQRAEADLESIYVDRIVPLKQLKAISDAYAVQIIDAVNKANAGILSAGEARDNIKEARRTIEKQWREYTATQLTVDEKRLADKAQDLFEDADSQISSVDSKLAKLEGSSKGEIADVIAPLYKSIDPVTSVISKLSDLQIDVAGEMNTSIKAQMDETENHMIIGSVLALALLAALAWLIARSITSPVTEMAQKMSHVAAHSDLTTQINVTGSDEIATTSTNFNKMLQQFDQLIADVSSAAIQVASASHEMSQISSQTGAAIQRQFSETEQVATAVNEMAQTVQVVAQNAVEAQHSAQSTSEIAVGGRDVVARSKTMIDELVTEITTIADELQVLEQHSDNIGSVVDVINSIAEQTNLLALNAAIEAARAGDQGRGFAVVADEVRTLAQRTQDSTQHIRKAVEDLQRGAKNAAQSIRAGCANATRTGEQSSQAAEALTRIVDAVNTITEMNTQIASAAEEQSAVAEEISRSVVAIRQIAETTSTSASEAALGSEQLSELAHTMQDMVGVFKTTKGRR